MKNKLLLFAVLLIAFFAGKNVLTQNQAGDVYRVRAIKAEDGPVKPHKGVYRVKFAKANSPYFNSAMKLAMKDWTNKTGISFKVVKTGKCEIDICETSSCTGDMRGRVGLETSKYYEGDSLAYCGKIYINAVVIDMQHTSLVAIGEHEIGHALGLSHDKNKSSVMYDTSVRQKQGITKANALRAKKLYRLSN